MPSLLDSVTPRHLAALVGHLQEQGHDCATALRQAGLTPAMLAQPRVPIASVMRAMQALLRDSGRSDLGFVRGRLTQMGTGDAAGQMLLSAATLREALQALQPHAALVSPAIAMRLRADGADCLVEWTPALPMPYELARVALETVAVAFHRQVLFALQERELPLQLDFSWPAPPHAARYRELRGLRVRFGRGGAPAVMARLPAAVADRPLPMADARALREALRSAGAALRELARERSFSDWVRHALAQAEDEWPTLEQLAGLLRMSGKTLARHLAREGTQFAALARELRGARARRLLAESALPVGDIAHRLGYATLANFCRSFKAATGLTPAAYRAAAAAAPGRASVSG
ncbi:AraC family transcriptional regulator [Pelomonas sp. CA6]|uniref:AraC family transcriptional regulator n=1 Tax=Pelomonas sp. CA6 TaxID=2907999 RepID=UPI001F4AECAB|nr:AraC family transcriptional regulator [Pelomonas sp. CA6]MCH7341874.1 AraC family transcriptional regulator [Pelomonas sp. CA6]